MDAKEFDKEFTAWSASARLALTRDAAIASTPAPGSKNALHALLDTSRELGLYGDAATIARLTAEVDDLKFDLAQTRANLMVEHDARVKAEAELDAAELDAEWVEIDAIAGAAP